MNKLILIAIFLGLMGPVQGQLNSYKYIVVPKEFDAFKNAENHFQTSTLIKHLFTREGFTVVYVDDLPSDLENDKCLGAYVDVEKTSKLLSTKITLMLNDCYGESIMRAVEGSSRNKDYKGAYHEAIRQSFTSFANIDYNYKPAEKTAEEETVTVSYRNDIKSVDTTGQKKPVASAAVVEIATPEERYYKDQRPQPSDYTIAAAGTVTEPDAEEAEITPSYTAKATTNGFELIDSDSKLWLNLYETSTDNVYLARNENENGMVIKRDSKWFFEYYEGSELKVKEVNINFQ